MSNSSEPRLTQSVVPPLDKHLHGLFRSLIAERTGITQPLQPSSSDRLKMQNRLAGVLKRLGLSTFEQLWNELHSSRDNSAEWVEFIHAVSIHKTDFFRESSHFDRLAEHARTLWNQGESRVRVWSAACSTGEEAVSAAIILTEEAQGVNDFEILATDLDSVVLGQAKKGIYRRAGLAGLDLSKRPRWRTATGGVEPDSSALRNFLKAYFLDGRGEQAEMVRVKDNIRRKIRFAQFNLVQPNYPENEKFDAIFCRNVLIYFDEPTRDQVVTRLAKLLAPNGLLLLGHSESFAYREDLEPVAPTVYRNRKPQRTHREHR